MEQYFILKMQYNEEIQKGVHRLYEVWQLSRSSYTERSRSVPGKTGCCPPRNHLGSEDVLLEETLLDELFQVSLRGPAVDGLVPLTVMVRVVLFSPEH